MRPSLCVPALVGLAALAGLAGCQSLTPARRAAHADRGVAWLCAHQNADGSFGSFDGEPSAPDRIYADGNLRGANRDMQGGASALAGIALIEPARTDPKALAALEKTADFCLRDPLVVRSAPEAFYNAWSHAYRLELCARLLRAKLLPGREAALRARATQLVAALADLQAADGGWCYYDFERPTAVPSGRMSSSFLTACSLRALRQAQAAGIPVAPRLRAAPLGHLRQCRLSPTVMSYDAWRSMRPNDSAMPFGAAGRTCVGQLALAECGDAVSAAALAPALASWKTCRGALLTGAGRPVPHQAPGRIAGYYFWFSHCYAAQTAERLGDRDMAAFIAKKTVEGQADDGWWFDFPIPGVGRTYATAFGLLALQSCERTLRKDEPGFPPHAAFAPVADWE